MKTRSHLGYTITHTWPKQWEVVDVDGVTHLFPSLATAKAWLNEQRAKSLPEA